MIKFKTRKTNTGNRDAYGQKDQKYTTFFPADIYIANTAWTLDRSDDL
jgi:hypothetical protein